jgi:L-asparaginase
MKIKIFTAGGTIDKVYGEVKGTYNFSFGESAICEMVKNKIKLSFEYSIESLLAKDSLDMEEEDRQLIKKACQKATENKILITHGTDTMVDTAKTLSDIKDKVIVLTGASQPWSFRESDAEFNIGVAIGALNVLKEGIYVVMNGRVYDWDKVQKIDSGKFIEK